jgi:hypothetical protein
MSTQARHPPSESELLEASRLSLTARLGALKAYLAELMESCMAYYEAAALYDQLSGLSNAELHRRGLSRETLARDVCDACAPRQDR